MKNKVQDKQPVGRGKKEYTAWCRNFGHIILVFTNNGLLVRHKCILCNYFMQTFMGYEPKLKFKRITFYKTVDIRNAVSDIKI